MKIRRQLFFSLISYFCFFICSSSYAANTNDAKKIIDDYATQKKLPVVVGSGAIENFLNKEKKWKWIDINGISIGYSGNEFPIKLSKKIKKHMDLYFSLRGKYVEDNIKLTGYKAPASSMLKYFSKTCGVDVKFSETILGDLYFLTESKVTTETVCQVLIYSFTLNEINLKADRKNNTLIASQKK